MMITSNLKCIMAQKKVSIAELVESARVSHDTIARVRLSKRIGECKLNTLEKISKALGCKVRDLFEEERD